MKKKRNSIYRNPFKTAGTKDRSLKLLCRNLSAGYIKVGIVCGYKTILLGSLLLVEILGGCAVDNRPVLDISLNNDEISQLNEAILSKAQMNSDPSEYLLGTGDLLQVTVFEARELRTKVRVSSRGHVTLPLIGQVEVKGLSARAVEQKIENLYRERFIKNPHVSIFIEEHYSQRVTLVGQFKTPGTYDFLSKQRLMDVIALGGGLGDKAGRIIQVRRSDSRKGEPQTFIIDLDRLVQDSKDELNIEIAGGDVLFVPEAGVFFVDGAVRKPGAYHIKHKSVVQEALLAAGGFAPYANKDQIRLVRIAENGKRNVIVLDLQAQGTRDLEIKDRDIIIVDTSGYGKLIHGLGIRIGIPGAGIGYRDPESISR